MLKTYNEFLNEKNKLDSFDNLSENKVTKAVAVAAVGIKFAGVPFRILRQLYRYKVRKKEIAEMIKKAETRKEKAELKKKLIIMSKKEFEAKKEAQVELARKKAKAAKK